MTAIRPGRERPPPENENPGAAPAAPGQSRTQRQDKARKAILQGSSTAAAPNWKQIAEEAWSAPSWKVAALEYHEARQRSGGTPQPPDLTAPRSTRFDPEAYCDTCGSRPCANPTFCLACRDADMLA